MPAIRNDLNNHDLSIYGRANTMRQWQFLEKGGQMSEITNAGRV